MHNIKRKKSKSVNCYLCSVDDPNEEHFNSHKYGICLVHAVSLWELAKEHLVFEARGSTVVMRLEKKPKKNSGSNAPRVRKASATGKRNTVSLELSSGYEVTVDLSDTREGMEHLSRALIGEVFIAKAKEDPKAGNPFGKGVDAVSNEIAALIEGMDIQSAKTLLKAMIWAGFMNEMERVETRRNQAN
jgi:hypothetical protein